MNKRLHLLISGLILTGWALPGHAQSENAEGLQFIPSISILKESGTLLNDQTVTDVDLRLGYRIASGFYFGMIYFNTSSGGTSNLNGSGVGNSIGYFTGPLSLIASYIMVASLTESTPVSYLSRSEGSGFQFDLSLLLPIGSNFYAGPQVTFKNLVYLRQQDGNGLITNNMQTQAFLYPYIALAYSF